MKNKVKKSKHDYCSKDALVFSVKELLERTGNIKEDISSIVATHHIDTGIVLLNYPALKKAWSRAQTSLYSYKVFKEITIDEYFSIAVSHEILHKILRREVSDEASRKLDALTVKYWDKSKPLTLVKNEEA